MLADAESKPRPVFVWCSKPVCDCGLDAGTQDECGKTVSGLRNCRSMDWFEPALCRRFRFASVRLLTAWAVVAEIGTDMTRFADAAHLASWAGLCPGNSESAGKRHSGRTRKGNSYLRRALCLSAWAAARTNNSFLSAVFFRIARRSGLKKAAIAIAHRLLVIISSMLRDGTDYRELGGNYFDRLQPERTAQRLLRRLDKLGLDIVVTPRPAT